MLKGKLSSRRRRSASVAQEQTETEAGSATPPPRPTRRRKKTLVRNRDARETIDSLIADDTKFRRLASMWFDAYSEPYFTQGRKGIEEGRHMSRDKLGELLDDLLSRFGLKTLKHQSKVDVFQLFDASGDGFLDQAELERGLRSLLLALRGQGKERSGSERSRIRHLSA